MCRRNEVDKLRSKEFEPAVDRKSDASPAVAVMARLVSANAKTLCIASNGLNVACSNLLQHPTLGPSEIVHFHDDTEPKSTFRTLIWNDSKSDLEKFSFY